MKSNKGFTLVEMIVTIVILSVLMAVVVPVSMRYFDDVNDNQIINEANAVYQVAKSESSSKKDSLAGIYHGDATVEVEVLDQTIRDSIVDKAHGKGQLTKLTYKDGEIKEMEYVLDGKTAIWKAESNSFYINK